MSRVSSTWSGVAPSRRASCISVLGFSGIRLSRATCIGRTSWRSASFSPIRRTPSCCSFSNAGRSLGILIGILGRPSSTPASTSRAHEGPRPFSCLFNVAASRSTQITTWADIGHRPSSSQGDGRAGIVELGAAWGKAEAAIESGAGLVGRRQPGEFATISMEALQHVAAARASETLAAPMGPAPDSYQLGHLADAHQAGAGDVLPSDAGRPPP